MTETDMFLRVLELYMTTGGSLVRTIISNTHNKLGFATLPDFLNDDDVKHQMFHLWRKQCCCKERITKTGFTRTQWLKMYRIDSGKCDAITHPPLGDCFCQYASPATAQPDILDVSVGETIISSIDCLKMEVSVDVLEALSIIKEIRNYVSHKTKMTLDLRQFNKAWTGLTRCLVTLGEFIDEEMKMKVEFEISSLQDKTYDAKDKIITSLFENMVDTLSVEENNTKLSGIEDKLSTQHDMLIEILSRLPSRPDTSESESSTEQETEVGPIPIKIIKGDITQEQVDVIVNTTSEDFNLSRGSVSRRILKQGGQIIQNQLEECCQAAVDSGMVAKTSGGSLPCSYIYHGWLPRWGESHDCKEKLSSFIGESLNIAGIDKMTSIAMPAIGTGILGYPGDLVAREIFDTVANYFKIHPTSSLKEVTIVIFPTDEDTIQAFESEESRWNGMLQRN